MLVTTAQVRAHLALPASVTDDTVARLAATGSAAVAGVIRPDACLPPPGTPAGVVEVVLAVCKDVWLASRHTYDTDALGGFTPSVSSVLLRKYDPLLTPYRDLRTVAM
jgi:hypothetical protein